MLFRSPVHPEDIPKTDITIPFGAFQFHYMNFGICGASQAYQRFIDTVLCDLQAPASSRTVKVFAYIGDILIVSSNEQEHMEDLSALFARLSECGLRVSPHKCLFGQKLLEFLGHHLTEHCSTPLPEKVSAIKLYPRPRNAKELRRYLGMINFYRRFVPHAAATLAPLYGVLTRHNKLPKITPLKWSNMKMLPSKNPSKTWPQQHCCHILLLMPTCTSLWMHQTQQSVRSCSKKC